MTKNLLKLKMGVRKEMQSLGGMVDGVDEVVAVGDGGNNLPCS